MTRDLPGRVSPFGYLRVLTPADDSSKLFAVNHALLRLLVPRHPLCALIRLTTKVSIKIEPSSYSVFKVLPYLVIND